MIRALIFDFDGTILDTETPEWDAWAAIYREENCPLPSLSEWTRNIGRGGGADETVFVRFDPHTHLEMGTGRLYDRETVRVRRRAYHLARIAEQGLREGIAAYLRDAKALGLSCAVASSSGMNWVGRHLEERGLLPLFDVLVTADDVQRTKPAPDVYLLALDRLNVAAHEAIALEDSPNGITAAKSAGLFTVAFPNPMTRDLPLEHADVRLDLLHETPLAELIAKAEQKPAGHQP